MSFLPVPFNHVALWPIFLSAEIPSQCPFFYNWFALFLFIMSTQNDLNDKSLKKIPRYQRIIFKAFVSTITQYIGKNFTLKLLSCTFFYYNDISSFQHWTACSAPRQITHSSWPSPCIKKRGHGGTRLNICLPSIFLPFFTHTAIYTTHNQAASRR